MPKKRLKYESWEDARLCDGRGVLGSSSSGRRYSSSYSPSSTRSTYCSSGEWYGSGSGEKETRARKVGRRLGEEEEEEEVGCLQVVSEEASRLGIDGVGSKEIMSGSAGCGWERRCRRGRPASC